jgi:gluconate kinase
LFAAGVGALFIECNDLHPEANLRKMAGDVPLTVAERKMPI